MFWKDFKGYIHFLLVQVECSDIEEEQVFVVDSLATLQPNFIEHVYINFPCIVINIWYCFSKCLKWHYDQCLHSVALSI